MRTPDVDPPSSADGDAWSRLEERLERDRRRHRQDEADRERRGALVAVLGDIAIVATCAGCLLVAIACIVLAIWRRL